MISLEVEKYDGTKKIL